MSMQYFFTSIFHFSIFEYLKFKIFFSDCLLSQEEEEGIINLLEEFSWKPVTYKYVSGQVTHCRQFGFICSQTLEGPLHLLEM